MNKLERKITQDSSIVKTTGLGIRGLFRVSILAVVALASLTLAIFSFMHVTTEERERAEASIRSEINYLCLQLESLENRANTFTKIVNSTGADQQKLESENPDGYRLLSNPIGDILSGYTLAETGTVAIIVDGKVAATDDNRVPVGSDVRGLLGNEVCDAIVASLEDGQMKTIPYNGVFDETGGAGSYGDGDKEAFLLAGQQGDSTVMIIEPMSMVFRDRNAVMGRETVVGLVLLIVVSLIVDRMLSIMIARHIDYTNEVLERITSGDLEARVEEKGSREFVSLANGINVTVEALQGWIAEAESRMDSELAAARSVQESALPRTFPPFPDIPAFDVYASMNAAKEVGGDFYDFFLVSDGCGPDSGKIAFVVADVSGKGMPAALFMMKAKALLHEAVESDAELGAAVAEANRQLVEGNDAGMFVTAWVGVLDYGTGHVNYVNAGHNPPLMRRGGGWEWLTEKSGLPMGLFELPYETHGLDCEPDSALLLYSDGVTEAMNVDGALYGENRLEIVANANTEKHPEALVKAVRADVAAYAQGAEQSDDITILAIEISLRAE